MATQRTPQALNARPGMQININTPGLQVTTQPVNTAVQAEDTSRQYLASSNAIAQSVINFGKTLTGIGMDMAPKAQKQNDTLELLKAENMALQNPTPGVTLGDKFNTDMAQLGSPVDIDKVHLTYGSTRGMQIGEELSGTIATQYNEGSQGFQKGNFAANAVKVKELYGKTFAEAESIPDEMTREAFKNSLLKQQDKILVQLHSMDIKVAEEFRKNTTTDEITRIMPKLFTSLPADHPAVTEHLAELFTQAQIPQSRMASTIIQQIEQRVSSGLMTDSEAIDFLNTPLGGKGQTLSDYVDKDVFAGDMKQKHSAYLQAQAKAVDSGLIVETEKALLDFKKSIASATSLEELDVIEENLMTHLNKMFVTKERTASAIGEIGGALLASRTRIEKTAAKAQKEIVSQKLQFRDVADDLESILNKETEWTPSTQRALVGKIMKAQPDITAEKATEILTQKGLPDVSMLAGMATKLNGLGSTPQLREQNIKTLGQDIRKIADNIAKDTTGYYRHNLWESMRDTQGRVKPDHMLASFLVDELSADPSLLLEGNAQRLTSLIENVANYRDVALPDEEWAKVVKKTRADMSSKTPADFSRSFEEYINSPSTRLKASLKGFGDSESVSEFLKADYEEQHVKVSDNAVMRKDSLKAFTGLQDIDEAVEGFQKFLFNAVLLDDLRNNDLPDEVLKDEAAARAYLLTKETSIQDVIKSVHMVPMKANPDMFFVFDKNNRPLATVNVKEQRAMQQFNSQTSVEVNKQGQELKDLLGSLTPEAFAADEIRAGDNLKRATEIFKHLRRIPEDQRILYNSKFTDDALGKTSLDLAAKYHTKFATAKTLAANKADAFSKQFPMFSQEPDMKSVIGIMAQQKPLGALVDAGGSSEDLAFMPGLSEHNMTAIEASNIGAHVRKSIEEYNSNWKSRGASDKSLMAFNVLMDATGGLAVPPKGSDNFFGFYLDGDKFSDNDSAEVLAAIGLNPKELPAKITAEGRKGSSVKMSYSTLRNARVSLFNKKTERVQEVLGVIGDDRVNTNLKAFAQMYPAKIGALTFLAANTGNNFQRVVDTLNSKGMSLREKKDAIAPLVLGKGALTKKQQIVENGLLMFYGDMAAWAAYHLPKNTAKPSSFYETTQTIQF